MLCQSKTRVIIVTENHPEEHAKKNCYCTENRHACHIMEMMVVLMVRKASLLTHVCQWKDEEEVDGEVKNF